MSVLFPLPDDPYVVNVVDGSGDVIVDALTVGSYVVNVTVVDGNYSAVNTTSFDVSAREIDVSVSVEDITYGESALVSVVARNSFDFLYFSTRHMLVLMLLFEM